MRLSDSVKLSDSVRLSDHPEDKIAYQMLSSREQVSYGELDQSSNQGAHLFRQLGIKTGGSIAIWLPNHAEFLKITWAAQRSGLYYTPISTFFKAAEVTYILENSDAQLLITNQALFQQLAAVPEDLRVLMIDEDCAADQSWVSQRQNMPTDPIVDESEGAEMIYSSGTTGQPKGVRFPLTHAHYGTVTSTLQTRINMHKIDTGTRYLSTAPMYHSAPLRYNMIVTRLGGTAFIMEKFAPEAALNAIEEHRITHSQWVPTMFVRLLKLDPKLRLSYDTSSLQFVIHAAAPCPVETKRQILDWLGPIVHEYYSGTEANGFTAINSEQWLEHPGSVGRPVTGEVHILDHDFNDLGPGETGTVYFGKGNDFSYHKDPVRTAEVKTKDGLSTLGDIGYVDKDGYLYLQDRKSFMIISGGVNIYPQEIENLLVTHPAVMDAAVFGIPNTEYGEEVKAVIQPTLVGSEQLAEELIGYCRDNLSHIKCPKSIDFIAEMPRHPTGKLYKQPLKAQYW